MLRVRSITAICICLALTTRPPPPARLLASLSRRFSVYRLTTIGEGQSGMSDPKPVIRDVVAKLAQRHPEEFADFWAKPEEQQSELIERYGTESDRGLWDKRNA